MEMDFISLMNQKQPSRIETMQQSKVVEEEQNVGLKAGFWFSGLQKGNEVIKH